jgi:hypothetical protein
MKKMSKKPPESLAENPLNFVKHEDRTRSNSSESAGSVASVKTVVLASEIDNQPTNHESLKQFEKVRDILNRIPRGRATPMISSSARIPTGKKTKDESRGIE